MTLDDNGSVVAAIDTVAVVRSESLKDRARRLVKALGTGNEAPYLVAEELHAIGAEWERHQVEADGRTFPAWCKATFGEGRDAEYWNRRWRAMFEFGREIRRNVQHDVAAWLVGLNLPKEVQSKARDELVRRRMAHPSRQPLSPDEARRALRPIVGSYLRNKVCTNCERLRKRVALLEELLTEHGVAVPE